MINVLLETERLYLRPFTMDDDKAVLAFSSNPKTQEHTGDKLLTSIQEVHDIIKNTWYKEYEAYGYGRFAVIHKKTNTVIGFNGIKYIPEIKVPDLGYRLLPEYWGKGIATESSKAILEFAFCTLKLDKVVAFTYPNNTGSIKVLEKLGFSFTKWAPYPGETDNNIHWYHLLRKTYERQ